MTLDEYEKDKDGIETAFGIQQLWLARYGVNAIEHDENETEENANGRIVFTYTLPESIDLPEELAVFEANGDKYDMRKHEDILAFISRNITDLLFNKAKLEVLSRDDYKTEEEKNLLIDYIAKTLSDETDVNIGIRWGETWTESDYYSGIDYYNSRVVGIETGTPNEVADLIIAKYKEEFGGDVGVLDLRDDV